jgi:hypothetical protein
MKKGLLFACFAMALFGVLAPHCPAAPFEPLFRIIQLTGGCTVMLPGTSEPAPAIEGKAYPFGTRIRTDRKGLALVQFSTGNECRILANASVAIADDVKDARVKVIRLDAGKIEVEVQDDALQDGGLMVETCCASCSLMGCNLSVEVRNEQDLATTAFAVKSGKVKVFGTHYEVPVLDMDDVLFVSCATDRSFIRIRNIQGAFSLSYRDSEGNSKLNEMQKDEIVKIWRKPTAKGDKASIIILYALPDGSTKDTQTYTEPITEPVAKTTPPVTAPTTPGEAAPPAGEALPSIKPVLTVDVPTLTPTSSTVPPDQRGKRPPTPTEVGLRF